MKGKIIAILLATVIAITGLVSCRGTTQQATYKIGVAVAQSGIYAGLGSESMEGIQFVVDQANNEGGIKSSTPLIFPTGHIPAAQMVQAPRNVSMVIPHNFIPGRERLISSVWRYTFIFPSTEDFRGSW